MKLLIDTNILIPLEPTSPADREPLTEPATTLARLCAELGHPLYVHPASFQDLAKDTDAQRTELRRLLLQKYPVLPDPPEADWALAGSLGSPPVGTNDWIDNQLVVALHGDAVDFLVSEDRKLRNKARRVGLADRTLTVHEAIGLLNDLYERVPGPPPAVRATKAHAIHASDPILQSFREDYPAFDKWLQKCKLEHRLTWVIDGDHPYVAAFCIVKTEESDIQGLEGKVLKLCSFKVSERHNGLRYGELLLKAVFEHAHQNRYDWMFITVFERHAILTQLLDEFGFVRLYERTKLGELILAKRLRPYKKDIDLLTPLEYYVRYGPAHFIVDTVSWYAVPIQPRFATLLFPETAPQLPLFVGVHPFGNAIRKAYLCNAPIRNLDAGDVLLFYQSGQASRAVALGVVEATTVSSSPDEVARVVGKRTVYSLGDIRDLCDRPVLAILFRQCRALNPPIPGDELVAGGVFKRAPQTIMQIGENGKAWLRVKIER